MIIRSVSGVWQRPRRVPCRRATPGGWPGCSGCWPTRAGRGSCSRRSTVVRLLGADRPVTLARAPALGAASSSCSYAAVALARSLFRKGANFTAAMVFEIASTNLVIELGIILALLISWQFTLAEFVGGPLMIGLVGGAIPMFCPHPASGGRPGAG